jgi:hypothetical protein
MNQDGTPMGPGFFIFFHAEEGYRPRVIPLPDKSAEDIEGDDIIKILFSFLQNGDIK